MGPRPGPRPYRMNGAMFKCAVCGEEFYRRRSFILRGINKTCGKSECKSKFFSGSGNPAWGHIPSQAARDAVRQSNLSRPKRTGPPTGWKHTPEEKAKISAALRQRWLLHRDKMIASITKSKRHGTPRHRREFTPWQKANWRASFCAWCAETSGLELDHVISIAAGGVNVRQNAQTLCRKCNLWKMAYVDRPQSMSFAASKAASES